jgi:hypothetical protein
MESAFGIDHGEISKAKDKYDGHGAPTTGRRLAGHFGYGFHGAVAGKKGKKLRATGTEVAGAAGGAVGGNLGGRLAGAVLSRGHPVAASIGGSLGSLGGGIAGSQGAVNRLQRKGYYKKQKPGAM